LVPLFLGQTAPAAAASHLKAADEKWQPNSMRFAHPEKRPFFLMAVAAHVKTRIGKFIRKLLHPESATKPGSLLSAFTRSPFRALRTSL
jgi:hypothetical protein